MPDCRVCCSTCRRDRCPKTYRVRAKPSRPFADPRRTAPPLRPYVIESGVPGMRAPGLKRAPFDDGRANVRKRSVVLACVVALVALGAGLTPAAASDNIYTVTRLVSDQNNAQHQDPNLVNAWGLVAGPSTPWWVANNHSNTSTLYDGSGNPLPLVVKVAGAPTGPVFNGGPGFEVAPEGATGPALFLSDTESGVIRVGTPNVPAPAPSTKAF